MRVFAFVILTFVLGASPASAWQEYIYLDQGFAIQFMAKPQVTTAPYQSTLVKDLRATVYSQEDDHVLYRMTVVDLAGHTDAGANFLNEAAYNLMREGEVIFNDFPRVYQDAKAIYGVTLVVDRPDGRRVRTSPITTRVGSIWPMPSTPARATRTNGAFALQTVRFP
jgi:hypothetical protein